MAEVHRTIVINRPVDEVFAYFADISNDLSWRHGVKEIAAAGPILTGTQITQKLAAGPLGMTVKADMDVVAYEPPKVLAFQVTTGPLRPRVEFRFAPVGQGTEVSFSIEAPLTGLKKVVMGRMAEKDMAAEAAALDNAKRLLEG
jgi:carbon monoxide dehydrogenase subunit G